MRPQPLSEELRSLEILVVDDNDHSRNLVAFAVEMNTGIAPRVASSGKEALELMTQKPADVAISDLFMPELDGFQFLLRVRDLFPLTKVVLVSNDFGAYWVTPRRMIAEGAIAVVPKIEVASTLIHVLRKLQANR